MPAAKERQAAPVEGEKRLADVRGKGKIEKPSPSFRKRRNRVSFGYVQGERDDAPLEANRRYLRSADSC